MAIRAALNGPLAPLTAFRQFIVYKVVPSQTRPGKQDKYPLDFRTGKVANAHDPGIWTDAATALNYAAHYGPGFGVGFVLTDNDPFFLLDVDAAYQPVDRNNPAGEWAWSPLAVSLSQAFHGAAVEVSQSGIGSHIIGSGRPPPHSCKNEALGLELYHTGRFVALAGISAVGNAAHDCSAILPAIVAQYFPPDPNQVDAAAWTDGPVPEWNGPTDDEELIRRAMNSKSTGSAFGGKASFADLWTGNVDALCRAYPDDARGYNASQADAALAQHLAFWTGCDCDRIARLMWKSALAREKWTVHKSYLQMTITGAISRQVEVLTDKGLEPVAGLPTVDGTNEAMPRPTIIHGNIFANLEQQLDVFKGCVYVRDQHKILVPGGILLKPEQFKVQFGGYRYAMDGSNEKFENDAWTAFTQNQGYRCPKVDGMCFRPDLPPGSIVTRNGQTFVNTYHPVEVARMKGDITPFLTHLAKVVPDEQERLILLSYSAACVQHQGVKFQWAPLLQGVEGNGKTLFTRCVAEAVGRRYVHWPKASKLCKEFNAWMIGKVFYGVEDIYVPDQKREIIEELKPMITGGDGLEIEGKGVDQISADICGNFMFNSNHRDAVRKTHNDRRYCVIYSAQQKAEDLARDGMTGDYFPNLYNWLKNGGYAIVSEFLWTFQIPDEYNPATLCQRAPITRSTADAIKASMGGIEQEIEEAVEQALPGFAGGWISSIMLDRLLEQKGAARRLPYSKRNEMLHSMGYDYHPALKDGRVNNTVLPDGGKPRLFVHKTSYYRALETAAEAAAAYEQCNRNTLAAPFPVHP